MLMVVEFDVGADIINVPQDVINNKDSYRSKFLKWLYSPENMHSKKNPYRIKMTDSDGRTFYGMCYRSEAFVKWLNKKVLKNSSEKAEVVIEHTYDYADDLPKIFF